MTKEKKASTYFFGSGRAGNDSQKQAPERVCYFLVMAAATGIILVILRMASVIVAPVLMALFLTIILIVPLRWLRKKGCSNIVSLIIVLGCTGIVFLGIGLLVGKSLNDFIVHLPAYKEKITVKVEAFGKKLEEYGFAIGKKEEKIATEENNPPQSAQNHQPIQNNQSVQNIEKTLQPDSLLLDDSAHSKESVINHENLTEQILTEQILTEHTLAERALKDDKPSLVELNAESVTYWVGKAALELRHLAESGFLVMIITLFMIFEASRFPEKIDWALGKTGPINNEHLHHIAGEIRRYLFIKSIACVMSSSAATIVYLLFGVPGALLWGVVAFFLYFIPNIGGIIAAIIPGLLIFMAQDLQGVLFYAVCLVAIECAIGYGIEPKMLGHGLGISTVVIFLSLLSWGWILGPVGLFLAAPLTIMVKIILQAFKETEWIAILLGDKCQPNQTR